MASAVARGLSPSRSTPSRYIRSLKFSRVRLLFSSAVLPSRTTITLSGSPLLDKVRSMPRANAITRRKTATVKPIVKAVASVLPLRTTIFRKLYFSGRAILFSAPQCFGDRKSGDSIGRINYADQANQDRQYKGCHQRLSGWNEGREIRNVKTKVHRAENQLSSANADCRSNAGNQQSLSQEQTCDCASLESYRLQSTDFFRAFPHCHRHSVAHHQ